MSKLINIYLKQRLCRLINEAVQSVLLVIPTAVKVQYGGKDWDVLSSVNLFNNLVHVIPESVSSLFKSDCSVDKHVLVFCLTTVNTTDATEFLPMLPYFPNDSYSLKTCLVVIAKLVNDKVPIKDEYILSEYVHDRAQGNLKIEVKFTEHLLTLGYFKVNCQLFTNWVLHKSGFRR